MSWVTAAQGGLSAPSVPTNLDEITDEEFLRQLWQKAEDFGDRRQIRARMYKLREKRLREMVQNDEENLGALTMSATDEGDANYEKKTSISDSESTSQRKLSNIEVKMSLKGDTAYTDSVTMQNVSLGGITMRGVRGGRVTSSDEEIIDERVKEVSKGRGTRYQQIKNSYDKKTSDDSGVSKSSYSIQSNALTGDSYQSMKHKEVRDSVSPTRGAFDRSRMSGEDSETFFTSDDEVIMKSESAIISRKESGEERFTNKITHAKSDASVKKDNPRKVTERKISKDLIFSSPRRTEKSSPTSPTRRGIPGDTKVTKKQTPTTGEGTTSPTRNDLNKKGPVASAGSRNVSSTKKAKMEQIANQMNESISNEYKRLDAYINESVDKSDDIINEEEEEAEDEYGNIVKMIVQTRRNKDGTECTTRRVARSTKVVDKESDIDEILIGNPEHEVLERNVEEKEEDDGSKIKIITETRRRPDGIEYTTKNVLRTSKIFDYDHPEDISYSENDELLSTEESHETDERGISIRTVTETRRKQDGTEYITKKVFKTSKINAIITPSDDDVILDSQETEEKQSDGSIIKTVIEKRRTKDGQEYTHRQIYRSRKLTLSSIEMGEGMPQVDNDDEIIDKKEKEELVDNKTNVKVVTETRRRKDGTTYSFDYVLRSFKGTESDIKDMPIQAGASNIAVSNDDKLLKEDVKEEVQKDGSTVKTITERRRAKNGTEYLRHRIMRIPKLPEPELQVGSLDDEVLEEDFREKILEDGTHCKAITERRRSSTTGVQYTLRRMSKVYQHHAHVNESNDEIIDENVMEEETANGIVIKTVIRRYERADGTFYTTHDIQKSYKNPVSVSIEGNEDDELVDRSYDERESNDGFIIKTIVETRCRSDGTHYTVERTEKVSKLGDNVQVSFKGNSICVGSPGDTVVSCEEHEEPAKNGTVIKTILEVRRRADGTQYTNKTTIKSTQLLVPDHETSYVVIKADDKNNEDDMKFFPSLEDEIVYTRKKKDVDEKGNDIIIVIETRKNSKTGELYNLTKRVHTTDVIMTTEGEKVFTNKRTFANKTKIDEEDVDVPYGSVSALKNRFSPANEKESTSSNKITVDRTKTANRKMFFEEAAAKTLTSKVSTPKTLPLDRVKPKAATPSYDKKNKDKSDDSSPERPAVVRSISPNKNKDLTPTKADKLLETDLLKTKKMSSPESSDTESRKTKLRQTEEKRSPSSPSKERPVTLSKEPKTQKDELPIRDRQQSQKTQPKTPLKQSIKGRSSDSSSPEQRAPETKSPAVKQPIRRSLRSRNEAPAKPVLDTKPKRIAQSPVPSSPKRGRSPLRSGASSSREGTPSGRPCCKHSAQPSEQSPVKIRSSPVLRKKPSDDKIVVNGEKKFVKKPNKESPDSLSRPKITEKERTVKKTVKVAESPRKSTTPRFERPTSTPSKSLERTPAKVIDRKLPEKVTDKDRKVGTKPSSYLQVEPKEPTISMPQTPLPEEVNSYPDTNSSVCIEDVSSEPDLPYQSVHRPSLIREPSEYPEEIQDLKPSKEVDERQPEKTMPKEVKPQKSFDSKPIDKPKTEKYPENSEDELKKPYTRFSSPSKRDYPVQDNARKPYERSRISPEKYESTDKPTDIFRNKYGKPEDKMLNGFQRTDSEEEPIERVRQPLKRDEFPSKKPDITESLLSQIIPDSDTKEPISNRYAPKEKSLFEPKSATTTRRPLFERNTKELDSPVLCKTTPLSKEGENRVPVVEPLVEKRYIHPLGSDDESDSEIHSKVEKDVAKLTSTRLVMNAMTDNKTTDTQINVKSKFEESDIITPLRDRSMSPSSTYSRSRSKEGSPSPFMKEDSPSRFVTGRPIDEGPNINKIKRLERSHSNKKIIYEDLEIEASKLPGYLVDIEYITDVTVLEKLLQKAESYEERRVIRGHIRNLKKTDTNYRTPSSSPAPYKRFIDSTTPSKPSPTSSPLLGRKAPAGGTTTSAYVPSYSRTPKEEPEKPKKTVLKAGFNNPDLPPRRFLQRQNSLTDSHGFVLNPERDKTGSPMVGAQGVLSKINLFERNESPRRTSSEETTTRKISSEDSWITRKSSREETVRKSSREESSRVTSSVEITRKTSRGDSTPTRKISEENSKPSRKTSEETSRPFKRLSSKEETKPGRKSSTDDDSTPKNRYPIEVSSPRKRSSDEDAKLKRKPFIDDEPKIKRKPSADDDSKTKRKPSTDEDSKTKRKPSTDEDSKTKRKPSKDEDSKPKRKPLYDDDLVPKRKSSADDEHKPKRKTSDNDRNIRTSPSRDYPKSPRKSSTEDSKPWRKTMKEKSVRKSSTEETKKYGVKISEEKKHVKKSTYEDTSPTRKVSSEEPKATRKVSNEAAELIKVPGRDSTKLFGEKLVSCKKAEPLEEPKRYSRTPSVEIDTSHGKDIPHKDTPKRDWYPKEKAVTKTPSRFGQEPTKDKYQPSYTRPSTTRTTPAETIVDKKSKYTHEETFVEPLRHQRSKQRAPVQQQTDVEKIVSPYGVGPTDENGVPLFGLRALKRRAQPTAPSEKEDFSRPKEEVVDFVPSDAQGKPLFGINAVRKSLPEKTTFTATQMAKETASRNETRHTATIVTEESHLTESLVSQQQTFETEVVNATNPANQSYPSTDMSSDDSQDITRNLAERRQRRLKRKVGKRYRTFDSEEEEENLKNLHKSQVEHHSSDDGQSSELEESPDTPVGGETSPALVKAVNESLRRRQSSSSESEDEEETSKNLKDIIKLHESKAVAETVKPDSSPKPRKKLRDSFEPTNEPLEPRTHRTWDLTTDLSTRSEAVGNIIAKHETLTKQEKKLTGILKKTSTSSVTTSKLTSSELDTDEDDDGLGVRRKAKYVEDDKKLERKTSYTEIKLSSPARNGLQHVETSPCATVGHEKSATFIRGTSRDDANVMTSQSNVIGTSKQSRSFLDDQSKVTGIADVLSRMGASEAVDVDAQVTSDEQARSLLNKFIGAQVLMTGVESMMANAATTQSMSQISMTNRGGNVTVTREVSGETATKSLRDGNVSQERTTFSTGPQTITYSTSSTSPKTEELVIVKGVNINEVTDDFELNQLLDSCEEYEERRRVRLRLKALMAEKKALQKELSGHEKSDFYSSSRRTAGVTGSKEVHSSEGGSTASSFSRGTTQVTNQKTNFSSSFSSSQNSSMRTTSDSKGVSAFDKFKQLDAGQPRHSTSVKSGPALSGPLFQLSSSLKNSAASIKDVLLTWCQCRTRDYQGVKIENFSTSWNDGLAFCALIHHFYPDSFDFKALEPKNRRHNFALAFRVADEKAGIYPLLDVDDMVMMQKPDWKSVFTYVQALYKRLKDE